MNLNEYTNISTRLYSLEFTYVLFNLLYSIDNNTCTLFNIYIHCICSFWQCGCHFDQPEFITSLTTLFFSIRCVTLVDSSRRTATLSSTLLSLTN